MNFSNGKKQTAAPVGSYGLADKMIHGLETVQSELTESHQLERHLKQSKQEQDKLNFAMLRRTQGIHAPLRLAMERKAAAQIQRLPCLPSSHLMLDTLTGQDEIIGFEDVLNNYEDSEAFVAPHVVIEKNLRLI